MVKTVELFRSNVETLFDLLPDEVVAQVQAASKLKIYRDGELIQQRGDSRRGISILMSGTIIAGNIGTDGSFLG